LHLWLQLIWYSRKQFMAEKKSASVPWLVSLVDKLPLATIAGLAGFTAVVVVLVLCGQFRTELIWSIGSIVAIVCGGIVLRFVATQRSDSRREVIFCDLLVLLGVVTWGGFHISLTSQHVLTNRDPATYAVASSWLSEHESFEQQNMSFSEIKGVHANSAGFVVDEDDAMMYPQGQHALPALLGSIGKFVGPVKVLHFNVLFGMTALLAVYCFARIFMRSRWAALATGIMAFSLPLVYFSRDTYTEPLALTFTFGGLALIALAQKQRSIWLWAIAGLVFSSSLLARIDAYLALIGVAAFFVIYVSMAKNDRRKRLFEAGAFTLPAIGVGVLAWLDLKLLSPAYYNATESLITLELLALGLVASVGLVAIVLTMKFPAILRWLHRVTKRWRAEFVAAIVLLTGLLLATLPLWYEPMGQQVNDVVAEIQQGSGQEVEARKYTELVGYWVSWYVGPVISVFGVLGLAYVAYRSMHDKNLLFLCASLVILGTSFVYFLQPSITPDQIWASRRMLPVIIPGVVVFGVYMFSKFADKIQLPSRYLKGGIVIAGSVMLLTAPMVVSAPFTSERLTTQHKLVDDICNNLPENATVVWLGLARLEMVQPTRTYCDVEAYGYHYKENDTPSRQTLATIAKKAKDQGKIPYLGVYRYQYGGLIDEANQEGMTEVAGVSYNELIRTLTVPPSEVTHKKQGASLGIINTDGTVSKIK
jgi:hypothetical protein